MSGAGRSLFVFGVYLLVLGAGLIAVPALVVAPFGLAPSNEPWLRVLGVVSMVLGWYYVQAARRNDEGFARASIQGRGFVFLAFGALVAARVAGPGLAVIGAVDLAGAAWTFAALRKATS